MTPGGAELYVLGAGASAAVTPTCLVTPTLLTHLLADTSIEAGSLDETRAFIALLTATAPDDSRLSVPAVDDVLSLIDYALSRRCPLAADWPVERLRALRHSLLAHIHTFIQREIDGCCTSSNVLTQLVRTIVAHGRQVAIVSLNWDCLVEEAIFSARGDREFRTISHGFPYYGVNGAIVEPLPEATLVLKPHGSISWKYCGLCSSVFVDVPRDVTRRALEQCPRCRTVARLDILMVAPTFTQWTEPACLDQVWLTVEDVIASCSRLTFIGYSLPYQDVDMKFHLVRALARRRNTHTTPLEVTVVAKTHSNGTVNADEARRYHTIVGPGAALAYLHFENGLVDWMRGGRGREVVS